jgi:predicted transcriptional regulator
MKKITSLPNELLEKIANYAVTDRMNSNNTHPFKIPQATMDQINAKRERSKQRDLFQALFNRRKTFRPRKR